MDEPNPKNPKYLVLALFSTLKNTFCLEYGNNDAQWDNLTVHISIIYTPFCQTEEAEYCK